MPEPAHHISKQQGTSIHVCLFLRFFQCRYNSDYKKWCNDIQRFPIWVFYKHAYVVLFNFASWHFLFTTLLAGQEKTLILLSEGGCGLFPLVSTGNVGVKCHRGITQGVSHCDWQYEISIFPSTACVSVSSFVYTFSADVHASIYNFSGFPLEAVVKRKVYFLSNVNSK